MMKMYKKIALSLISICIFNYSHACLNTYDEWSPIDASMTEDFNNEAERDRYYKETLRIFLNNHPKPRTIEEQNDYAVQLIYNKEYQQAIDLLLAIEKRHPNLANTAVNLGTAYELLGQLDQAEVWIKKGIRLDPDVHFGSEWIHLNIIKAKQQNADKKWFMEKSLLGIDFGTGYFPVLAKNNVLPENFSIAELSSQAHLQLTERKKFIFGNDPTLARLAYELANVEILYSEFFEYKYMFGAPNQTAQTFANIAVEHGLEKGKIEEKRLKMLLSDSFVYRFLLVILDFISKPFR